MGKLIKNHWGRLIVLTAAICGFFLLLIGDFPTNFPRRSNRSSVARLFLAENLLGFPHQEPRRRREADPRPPNYQSRPWHRNICVGMALGTHCEDGTTSQHRGTLSGLPDCGFGGGVAVSGYEPSDILYDRNRCIFLGI